MLSQSYRITYYTSENRLGYSRLWFASSTRTDFRNTLERHRIDPQSIFRFEVKKDKWYEEISLEKLMEIGRGE
ncbi:MAG TPA: hypothetical protein VJ824_12975 [Bacillota bacterium]|nr:hypothetical protein [Bacillota bacterium]